MRSKLWIDLYVKDYDLYYENDGNTFKGFVMFEYLSGCTLFIHVEGAGVQKIILTSIMGMDGQGPKMLLDQYQPGDYSSPKNALWQLGIE